METAHAMPRYALETALQRSFVEGAAWPVGPSALAALVDMGLTEGQIAQYFGVETLAVRALRRSYGFMV